MTMQLTRGILPFWRKAFCCLLAGMWLAGAAALPVVDANPRWATLADKVFAHLGSENGLPHSYVTALAVDAEGFLWVGTQGGLARWDGYRFRVYLPNPEDTGSLPDMYIRRLHVDSRGRLWIGTAAGGLVYYDNLHDRFMRLPVGPHGTSHATIFSLANDGNGGLWAGTENGLDHFSAAGEYGTVQHFRHDESDVASLPHSRVRALLRDRKGRLWIGTRKGLMLRGYDSQAFVKVPLPVAATPYILSLGETADGRIWVGTKDHSVFILDGTSLKAQALPKSLADGLDREPINFMEEVAPGQIWIGSVGKGVAVFDSATLQTRLLRHDAATPGSLLDNAVWAIVRDRSGLIWIGSQLGLNRHDLGHEAVLSLFGNERPGTLGDTDVTSVQSMPGGSIWLGLQNNGINLITPDTGRIVTCASPEKTAPAPGLVRAITAPYRGAVYVGTDKGLFRAELSGCQLQPLTFAPRDPLGAANTLLLEDHWLWVGGGDGLWRIDLAAPPQAQRLPGTAQLNQKYLQIMLRGPDGRLWIGTDEGELYRLDTATQQLQQIRLAADSTGSRLNYIADLLFDRHGRLWIATLSSGIYLLSEPGVKPLLKRIGTSQGLPHDLVNKLLEDQQGDIWASTDRGLARIDWKTLAVQSLQRAEGVMIPSYWSNSGSKNQRHELLFGGNRGLTVVRPELFKVWNYRPPVVITQVQIGGKEARQTGQLLIRPEANSIAVEFSALDYSAPERNRYAFLLEGYDTGWINADSTRRVASYTNLPPGDYRLRLRGSNRNGDWSQQERIVPIRVLPAWYQTWWFRLALVLAMLTAAWVLVQIRTRYLRQRRYQLAFQVRQRTTALHQKQQELVIANKELYDACVAANQANLALHQAQDQMVQQEKMASLGGLVAGIAHEINTPLGTTLVALSGISDIWQKLRNALHIGNISKKQLNANTEEGIEYTQLALSTATRAAELIAVFKTVAVNPESDRAIELDLSQYLPEVMALIKMQLDHSGCQLEMDVASDLTVQIVPEALTEVLTRVLVNVMDHAFVDGRTGTLRLSAHTGTNGEVEIIVKDNGHGIAAPDLPKVFDPFFTTRNDQSHVGLGLHVAYNHVTQRLKGQIGIASTPGQGTTVTIRLGNHVAKPG